MALLLRLTREHVDDRALRRLRKHLDAWQPSAASWNTGDLLLWAEKNSLRFYLMRAEDKGVDKGICAVMVFRLLADRTQAELIYLALHPDYSTWRDRLLAWCDAQLRAEGVVEVIENGQARSTEPRLDATGLPVRPRGWARL